MASPPQPTKTQLTASARYAKRLNRGDFIFRDAAGRMFWQSSGRAAAPKTVAFMLTQGLLQERDADIFGSFAHGQTIGKPLPGCQGGS